MKPLYRVGRSLSGVVLSAVLWAGVLNAYPHAARADKTALVSELHVEQAITAQQYVYTVGVPVRVSFRLSRPADVIVNIRRHLANWDSFQGPYIAEPFPVRTLRVGKLAAGVHTVTWDGLDAGGKPVAEKVIAPYDEVKAAGITNPTPAQLVKQVPVNLLQIEVGAGSEKSFCNFGRAVDVVDPNRTNLSFIGAVRDKDGSYILADRIAWRGRRFSPNWQLLTTYPQSGLGQSSDPVETYDSAIDSKGNVYLATPNGIYKFAHDGAPAPWGADEDYINYPYPSEVRNVLGVRVDPASTENKQFVFGPGGGGNYKHWVGAEQVKKPGFAGQWGGVAVDADDRIYLGSTGPRPEIQIFDNSGKYRRTLTMPDGEVPSRLRIAPDGALWVATTQHLLRLDATSGAVQKTLDIPARLLYQAADGTLWAVSGSSIWRLDAQGNTMPFSPQSPYSRDSGKYLDIGAGSNKAPNNAAGYTNNLMGVVDDGAGGVFVSETPVVYGVNPGRLLHLDKNGLFAPELVSVELGQHQVGNVFLDNTPAQVDVFVSNLATSAQTLALNWTLTDFDGHATQGTTHLTAAPLARQTLPLVLPAPANGHYTLHAEVGVNGKALTPLNAQLARIPSREIYDNRWSPFAMAWGTNYYLMALAGVKSQRGDSASWGRKMEPSPGVFYPTIPEAIQYGNSDIESYRRYARRWSDFLLNGLDYGENWLGGDSGCRLYSYDRFYGYVLRTLDTFQGKNEAFYQFWNEPNFFWHVPGPFSREHFALVTENVWSMVKARDKNAMCIPDGDAGGTGIMREMAGFGANQFNDGAQIHYPGATPITFDRITAPNLPEGKIPMVRELVGVRDASYPGKPIWNTEEGWWSLATKSPELGAEFVVRAYLPQMAAGVDKLYYFSQTGIDPLHHDPMCLLDENDQPFPAFVAYATMSRLTEEAPYIGTADLGSGTFAYAFARPNDIVLAVYSAQGQRKVQIPVTTPQVTVVDLMGRSTPYRAESGKLSLTLTERVQYVILPRRGWALTIGQDELNQQLKALNLAGAGATESGRAAAIEAAARTAANDPTAMSRLYYLVKLCQQQALIGTANLRATDAGKEAGEARDAVEKREGADGYLRQARVALDWTERLSHLAERSAMEHGATADGLAGATAQAARATRKLAQTETPAYPGVAINAYLEPHVVRDNADPKQPLDERFPFQIARKAGDHFDLELTVWNYYLHPISGTVAPRLPGGWTASPAPQSYSVAPGQFARWTFSIQIPAGTANGVQSIGGQTTYQGQTVPELHPQRVEIQ